MASILDRYGIKEVADVTFYKIENDGSAGAPVLYLDTLKVSTIEQTAETSYAQGGKGNPRLIGWDFGKEITLTLEDALFSPKSMGIMFGDGNVDASSPTVKKTVTFKGNNKPTTWTDAKGAEQPISGGTVYKADGTALGEGQLSADETYFLTFDVAVNGLTIEVGPNTFPGTYYITGDTYARNEVTGDDEYFQFIVPKGKITSENTITMEADGDPSVFSMTVDVLRATLDGKPTMMQLVKYNLTNAAATSDDGGDGGDDEVIEGE